MLTGRVPPEETLPTAFRPAGVRSITEMEPSPSLATKSHRRSWVSARAPWEPTDTTPPPAPPVGTVAARESAPSAVLSNTKTELSARLLSVYTNPVTGAAALGPDATPITTATVNPNAAARSETLRFLDTITGSE